LASHGVALRVRRQAGHWEATAKWAGRVDADVHERPELTVPLPGAPSFPFALPAGPLHTHLAALVARRPLTPILVSEVHRQVFDVLPTDGSATDSVIAELALDRVRLHGPEGAQPETRYYEIEIESRQGDRRDITALSRQLQRDFNLVPSGDSKF